MDNAVIWFRDKDNNIYCSQVTEKRVYKSIETRILLILVPIIGLITHAIIDYSFELDIKYCYYITSDRINHFDQLVWSPNFNKLWI